MTEFVWVRDRETKHQKAIPRAQFEHEGDVWEKLDHPAADAGGRPLPTKFHTSVSTETTKKKTTQSKKATQSAANTKKEK